MKRNIITLIEEKKGKVKIQKSGTVYWEEMIILIFLIILLF